VLIHKYVAYQRAQKSGSSSLEFEPDGKAAAEIRALVAFLRERLDFVQELKPAHSMEAA
jgi:hypothetical protein